MCIGEIIMKKAFAGWMSLFCLISLTLVVSAAPYRSLNEMCIVEKKGDGYWFLNGKELAAKQQQVFETQRNRFEWFFTENGQIQAKVYPALRDATIQAPDDLYMQFIGACKLTDSNQKLASHVSFDYRSKDRVCACLFEQGSINCAINKSQLARVPYSQWILFFETSGYPAVINGIVPPVLSKVWMDLPDDYVQTIVPCSHNTSNEEIVKQLEPKIRNLKR